MTREGELAAGRFGRVEDMRRKLMFERLRGDFTDTFYSMHVSDTEFLPHQFKPVLRFVESTSGRHLIADEVGLGKTIEALLVWKELEARSQARRLLIVCPSTLREKWRDELRARFRISGEILDASGVADRLREAALNRASGFVLIASYEALRSPRPDLNNPNPPATPRARFGALLDQMADDGADRLIDLVVADEAHYARNPETATNRLINALDAVTERMLLLSATPIQLNTNNLYQLLRLVDPTIFGSEFVFNQLLEENQPLIRAQRALLRAGLSAHELQQELNACAGYSPAIATAVEAMNGNPALSAGQRVQLARSIERESVLATSMTRTRKRDVFQNRVTRVPVVLTFPLSEAERRVYDEVTQRVIARFEALYDNNQIGVLAAMTRQRQMASSIPAALRAWSRRGNDLADSLAEDLGRLSDTPEVSEAELPLVEIMSAAEATSALRNLPDSKWPVFLAFLRERLRADPNEKFVVFSYFRETLSYLHERLTAAGIRSFLLRGGMGDEKWAVIRCFIDEPGPSVLLSSEVGSEGIDLQFCRTMVNYDLPWNPMRVEQRIGRLDRIGQAADRITIVNFVMQDTIEDDILLRLHTRIGVFEQSIGDIEAILGDSIQTLIRELFSDELTDQQREERAELNIQAIEERARQLDELESQASNLVAFSDYLINEIKTGNDLGRFVEPSLLKDFVADILFDRFPGTEITVHERDDSVYRVSLAVEAKASLGQFIEQSSPTRRTRMRDAGVVVLITTNPRWKGALRPEPELLDATHPLVLWIRAELEAEPASLHPLAAVSLQTDVPDVPDGDYVFAVDAFAFRGLRREARLLFQARDLNSDQELSPVEAERLVHAASRTGITIPPIDLNASLEPTARGIADLIRQGRVRHAAEEDRLTAENTTLCDRQQAAVLAQRDKVLGGLEALVREAHQSADSNIRRTLALREARLRKERERFTLQLHRIDEKAIPVCDTSECVAGLIRVSRHG